MIFVFCEPLILKVSRLMSHNIKSLEQKSENRKKKSIQWWVQVDSMKKINIIFINFPKKLRVRNALNLETSYDIKHKTSLELQDWFKFMIFFSTKNE